MEGEEEVQMRGEFDRMAALMALDAFTKIDPVITTLIPIRKRG